MWKKNFSRRTLVLSSCNNQTWSNATNLETRNTLTERIVGQLSKYCDDVLAQKLGASTSSTMSPYISIVSLNVNRDFNRTAALPLELALVISKSTLELS